MRSQFPLAATSRSRELDRILESRTVDVLFQPIVHLESLKVAGYEALARGPAGTSIASPQALFSQARHAGRESELDWICRAAAMRAALSAGLPRALPLFVNVEPRSLGTACPADLQPTLDLADEQLEVILEVTERSLASDPATLLAAVEDARQRRQGLALDDVGADPASLAMMSLICPDVIKLDLSLIQGRTTPAVARIVNAVRAEAERTGAAIVAEGIESPRHVTVARSMGAPFGQGWLFGRAEPLPIQTPRAAIATTAGQKIKRLPFRSPNVKTPFDAVAGRPTSRASPEVLLATSMHLEYKGLDAEPTVLLACFQDKRHLSAASRRRFSQLAARGVLTAVIGKDIPPEPAPGVRGAGLAADDPLLREWSVIVLGPHFAGAVLAKQCHEVRPERPARGPRMFDFVVTHDRGTVISAARPLLTRLPAGRTASASPSID